MTTLQQLHTYDLDRLSGIDDVCRILTELDEALRKSPYAALHNFNETYAIITRSVRAKLREELFDDPEFLSEFDAQFARYYLEAFQKYLQAKPVPPAWKITFDACLHQSATPFKVLVLGVNAHVNNDIAQALSDCHATDRHRHDYKRINKIIDSCLDDAFDSLNTYQSLVSPKHRVLQLPYRLLLRTIIRVWRWNAWHNYIRLRNQQHGINAIEDQAHLISKGAQILPL